MGGDAFTKTFGDAWLLITGVAIPNLNGVLTVRTSATTNDVASLLEIVARRRVPHSIQIRPGCSADIVGLARDRGLAEDEPMPLMAMSHRSAALTEAARPPILSIRRLTAEEVGIHASLAAEAFEAPTDVFERLVPAASFAQPGFRAYVGTIDGEPVTTALSSTSGDYVGVFDVATAARHRGRGYGAAITARAVLDGFNSGASVAYLQSSPIGLKVYEGLGFQTLETWSVWVSPQSHS
jgi:GNAT superfamily N-acetyltransferase